jgi:hypothetical protein
MGEGSLPYMSSPTQFLVVYSNCTTAKMRLWLCPRDMWVPSDPGPRSVGFFLDTAHFRFLGEAAAVGASDTTEGRLPPRKRQWR